MLRVSLLGQFEVQVEGKRVVIPARAAQSLLAFLILSAGTAHRREKLAGMLWPDMSDEGARRNLRHELWRLRKALGANQNTPAEYILSEELAIQFNARAEYWLDVAQLERAPAPDDAVGDLVGRLALYRGELLPGFYDDWVGPERDRVQALFESRMDELLKRLTAEERWLTALEWAERWIALGHTPEAAYRALMLAHNALGETGKIALDYERCAEAMRADLEMEPSGETRLLYEKLTHGEVVSSGQMGTTPTIFVQSSGTVTFLFSDIEGSTKLLDRLGPDYAKLLAEHQDVIRATAEKYNGHEIDSQGDSFFFAFFRAADAVNFAAEAQRALASYKGPQDAILRVRMGLHTGEPMLARTGYVGMDVHRAARIGAAGHGGQVLLSPSTRALVENELPQGTTLRDLGEHKLKDLRYPVHIVQLTIEGLPAEFPPLKSINTGSEPPAPGEPPFKGLDFFDEQDANLFFGREPLVEKLAQEVREHRFLAVVVGASGSGKSSVVRAGLIPALRATHDERRTADDAWQIYVMTPTAHPLEALAMVLTRDESLTMTARLLDDLAREPRSLYLYFKRVLMPNLEDANAKTPQRILLVVDQFEELFTLCRDDLEREQFIDNLVNALSQAPRSSGDSRAPLETPAITLVLTIRADFYAHLAEYPELRELVAKQQEYIGLMNADELRRAIEEPAKAGHWEFEPGLVDLILRDVGDEPGALPLLSHALLETWKRRSGHLMTLKGYHDAGGVRGAIALTAETTYQQLTPEEQIIARNIFLRLTELGAGTEDTRRRAEIEELETGEWERSKVRSVLTRLADARLITTGEHTAEVAHEALIREWDRLREWLNEDREGLKLHRNLTDAAHEWELMERDASVLYRGARLAQAQEFAVSNPNVMNANERAFLDASVENEKREEREKEDARARELLAAKKLAETEHSANKRLRRRAVFLTGVVVLALVAAIAAFFFLTQSNANLQAANEQRAEASTQRDVAKKAQSNAEKEQRLATSRELAAGAIANLDVDPERSILLALQAVYITKKADGTVLREAEEATHRAVQTSRVMQTYTGMDNPNQVAFSPNGSQIAVRSQGKIGVWDVLSGKALVTIPLATSKTDHVAFSIDGKQLATVDSNADKNNSIKIFDLQTGAILRVIPIPVPQEKWTRSALNRDWTRVVVGETDGTATVWDMDSGTLVFTLAGHSSLVEDVAYSADGTRIATASDDKTAIIWDAGTGKQLLTLSGHTNPLLDIVFTADAKRVGTGSQDQTAKVWDAVTGKELLTLAHTTWVNGIAFSSDGTLVATAGGTGNAKIWETTHGNELLNLAGHTGPLDSVIFSPDVTRLATTSIDGTARIWDITPNHEVLTLPTGGVSDPLIGEANAAYSPDGKHLAVGLTNGTVKVWDATNGKEEMILRGHTGSVHKIAYSPDGMRLVSASNDKTAKIWDMSSGKELVTLAGHSDVVIAVDWSRDGTRVVTGSQDQTVKIWDSHTGKVLTTFSEGKGAFYAVALNPDGTLVAASNIEDYQVFTGQMFVWDTATDKLLYAHKGGFADHIAFSPDGSRLVLADSGSPTVLDPKTGKAILNLEGAALSPFWIAYSPDGTRLATADQNGTAVVYDATSGKALLSLHVGSVDVRGVTFSPDGTRIATADDEAVRVFLLNVDDLVALAKTRVTRTLTEGECQKYLHVEKCPSE